MSLISFFIYYSLVLKRAAYIRPKKIKRTGEEGGGWGCWNLREVLRLRRRAEGVGKHCREALTLRRCRLRRRRRRNATVGKRWSRRGWPTGIDRQWEAYLHKPLPRIHAHTPSLFNVRLCAYIELDSQTPQLYSHVNAFERRIFAGKKYRGGLAIKKVAFFPDRVENPGKTKESVSICQSESSAPFSIGVKACVPSIYAFRISCHSLIKNLLINPSIDTSCTGKKIFENFSSQNCTIYSPCEFRRSVLEPSILKHAFHCPYWWIYRRWDSSA